MNIQQKTLQERINTKEFIITKSLRDSGKSDVRRRCFISYHHADQAEVETFIDSFEEVFIPKVVGVSDSDNVIDSDDTGYVMDTIREKYLTGTTVTIVLIGKCTWARKYVDWEIYSTLRDDKNNTRSGLLAISLPSVSSLNPKIPNRLNKNLNGTDGYAVWYSYPTSKDSLKSIIETAYNSKDTKAHLIKNSDDRMRNNVACP